MTALAHRIVTGFEHSTPLFSTVAVRIGRALRRGAAGRYAEQRRRVEQTGLAGMI